MSDLTGTFEPSAVCRIAAPESAVPGERLAADVEDVSVGARIWIDVEDMFIYANSGFNRPTGIQRLAFELCRALHARSGDTTTVQFVRQDPVRASFTVIPFSALERLFEGLSAPPPAPTEMLPDEPPPGVYGPAGMRARRAVYRLPTRVRTPLIQFAKLQYAALGALAELAGNAATLVPGAGRRVARFARRTFSPARPVAPPVTALSVGAAFSDPAMSSEELVFRVDAAPGDVLLTVGAGWFHPDYPTLVRRACADHGMRYALLVYDIIPLRRPEWCDRALVPAFRRWFDGLLPLCDTILSISNASAAEVSAYAAERHIVLPRAIRTIPIGTGFDQAAPSAPEPPAGETRPLPAPGSYALFVSTIEARKNHALLFRVWRRMLEEMPRDQVPTLVFAGRIGWLVSDLMQQMRNADYLDGKIVVVEHPTDTELKALYQGCRFTLFPSLYEGWGLPVTESLAFGKPCVISNSTSLPEAGGHLARYFDPENLNDALQVIRATIEDPAGLLAWEAQVVRDFKPVPWTDTADEVLETLVGAPADR